MLGFPIPQIVLAERADLAGHYFVLDGKQRLLALRQFFVDPDDDRDQPFNALRLSGLEVLTELNRMGVRELQDVRPDLLAAIENHSIRTVALSDWNSEDLLLSLFLRLNTGSVALSPQELRQALVHGDFITWLDVASGEMSQLRVLLNNRHPDRRMVDAELLLRFIAFASSPLQYRGNLKSFLDDTSRSLNRAWRDSSSRIDALASDFAAALDAGMEAFGMENFCRKWSVRPDGTARFERALNRAVFDFQVHSLHFPNVREAVLANSDAVLSAYKQECVANVAFDRAISSTTKTADAFITRHRVWASIVKRETGEDYELPAPLMRG